jgi:2-furoyl-CoA dehydrogenase large subunit
MTVSERYYFHRYSSTPLDLTSCVASYDKATEELTIWDHNQMSPMYHARYSEALNVPTNKLRIINPDIGGGFGQKVHVYSYSVLIALIAKKLGGSVRWISDRLGDMSAVMHQPDRVTNVEAAVKSDGTILGLKLVIRENFGAFIRHPEPQNVTRAMPNIIGCYKIGAVSMDATGVFTNTCPTGPNRGYGQQHACFAVERTVDAIARKLGVTPERVRFTNFVPPESMPFETPMGSIYDGGNYPLALKKAMELIEYEKVRARQKEMREKGTVLGLGLACTVEGGATAMGFARLWGLEEKHAAGYSSPAESAHVRMLPDGKAIVAMGTVPQGQGHETVASQIVAEQLGIQLSDVTVMRGFDSLTHPYSGAGSGTYAARFSQLGVGALLGAAGKIREKMLLIAAHRLKVDPSELKMGDGKIALRDKPDVSVSVRQIARIAHNMLAFLPPGMEPGLEAVYTYAFPYTQPVGNDMRGNLCCSYANLAGAATVQIDIETGNVKVNKLVIVHDNGRILNPLIVEGQVIGGAANGLAGALYEHFVYSDEGQLLTNTFVDYLAITSVEMPKVTLDHMETPSPFTPLGAKGCGEGAGILLPALIGNAVEDALAPFNVRITELPLTPNKIWEMLRQSGKQN